MTAARYTVIRCDGAKDCDAEIGTSFEATAAEVRTFRKPDWHPRPGGRDICPGCWTSGHR